LIVKSSYFFVKKKIIKIKNKKDQEITRIYYTFF